MIVAGASAYSRTIDFERLGAIARKARAYLMADIAHIAGLIAAGIHPSPVPHADLVTTTTHKTLRGPRSGMILCKQEHQKAVDRSVFPGTQGGPLVHVIAAKAVCLKEALTEDFREYQRRTVANAQVLSRRIEKRGYRIVSGGTDNHLFLVDVFSRGITGKEAEAALEEAGITVNKNTIPFDRHPPLVTSGIRIGTPAVTTRGMGKSEMERIGDWIARVLDERGDPAVLKKVRSEVLEMTAAFPLYRERIGRFSPEAVG